MIFYFNKYNTDLSHPHGKNLKGLNEEKREQLGYIKITNNNGERDLIMAKYNYKTKQYDCKVIKKREQEQIDHLKEEGFVIIKDFNSKEIKNIEVEAEDAYFPTDERRNEIVEEVHKDNIKAFNPYGGGKND